MVLLALGRLEVITPAASTTVVFMPRTFEPELGKTIQCHANLYHVRNLV